MKYKKLSLHAYGCRVIQKYLEKLHAELIKTEQKVLDCFNSQRCS